MDIQENVLKITDYDEILSLHGERLLLVTEHEEIFSLDETKEKKKLAILKDTNVKSYEEDDNFFDFTKEAERPVWFDFKKFLDYHQKRIKSKRAKENLHSKENFPLVNLVKENLRPRRQKLPYCQSEIFPSIASSQSSFFRRWHNFSLPRFTIYRTITNSLRFDNIASTLTLESTDTRRRSTSEFDFDYMRRLNELLYQQGTYEKYCLKSHLRQHKEDNDILELFRLYTAGLKKAPRIIYDSEAETKPSLKHIASLEVLDSEKAIVEDPQTAGIRSEISFQQEKKKREPIRFEQKPSILPDFRYTGEEQFRVIVYDDEVPYIDFELDKDVRKKKIRKTDSQESILKLRPNLEDIRVPEVMSDISLVGMGDYKMKPEDISKPVMLKFKNMPELLGWFRKINEKDMAIVSSETSALVTEAKVAEEVIGKPKKDFREVVVKTPMVGLKRFRPLDLEAGIDFKKLDVTTHDTILSILPKCFKKDTLDSSDSDVKEERLSMQTVVDKLTSSCILKKKPALKCVSYKTKTLKSDSLQRIKSSIVNEVVKKVASYFSKDLKPKLEASIKEGQCKCCQNKNHSIPPEGRKVIPGRLCMCNQKKPPKVSKGVNVDLNDLDNDSSSINCPSAGCRPNFNIFACPTITYFKNAGVNANSIQDHGSSGDSLSAHSMDYHKILKMYEHLAKTAEIQMDKLREYQYLLEEKPKKDVKFCKTVEENEITNSRSEDGRNIFDDLAANYDSGGYVAAADFSNNIFAPSLKVDSKLNNTPSEKPHVVEDYAILDPCSSQESVQSNVSKLNVNEVSAKQSVESSVTVSKITSQNKTLMEDTYNVPDITEFECYINYVCTHSEIGVQIPEYLTSRKLKRHASFTNLLRRKSNLYSDIVENDVNNNYENYSKDLVTLFKRDSNKTKATEGRNKSC